MLRHIRQLQNRPDGSDSSEEHRLTASPSEYVWAISQPRAKPLRAGGNFYSRFNFSFPLVNVREERLRIKPRPRTPPHTETQRPPCFQKCITVSFAEDVTGQV